MLLHRGAVFLRHRSSIVLPSVCCLSGPSTSNIIVEQAKLRTAKKPLLTRTSPEHDPNTNRLISGQNALIKYFLTEDDLKALPKQRRSRRSAFGQNEDMFLRTDVKTRAEEKYGVDRLIMKMRQPADDLHAAQHRAEMGSGGHEAMSVVKWAVALNGINALLKFSASIVTGSQSMAAEAVHSLADMANQCALWFGLHLSSTRKADLAHPYGYTNAVYVASLASGIGVLLCGAGLTIWNGVSALLVQTPLAASLFEGYIALGLSFFTDGITLYLAMQQLLAKSKAANLGPIAYMKTGDDSALNVVILEDSASMAGLAIAGGCMYVSHLLQLVMRGIPDMERQAIIDDLLADPMVLSVQDVKATEMGSGGVRFKAEVRFDGRNLARGYMESLPDKQSILREFNSVQDTAHLDSLMARHGEGIIELYAEEIDRLERNLKKKHSSLRHVDLEAL